MIRFVHSADWQLGARFKQFGTKGAALRNARLTTLRRVLEFARDQVADAFLIAGDLFEDNQVDESLVTTVAELFGEFSPLPVFILPGNHDPFTGPDSVWRRRPFQNLPPNITLLLEPTVTGLGSNCHLLASPLCQKVSSIDPSRKLQELAAGLPPGGIRLGITHGALAIEGKHQPNDFPIALDAASRAGLDYLGVGHWHNWLADSDGGRLVMPGTPEPDQFGQSRSGNVAYVEIDGPGQMPRVRPVPVATLRWESLAFDFLSADSSRATIEQSLAELSADAERAVLRITLSGTASPQAVADLRSWLESKTASFFLAQIVDTTRIALAPGELADLRQRHPILAQVLADIDQLEVLATGIRSGDSPDLPDDPLTLARAQTLLGASKIDLASLTPAFFGQLRQITFQALQEVGG